MSYSNYFWSPSLLDDQGFRANEDQCYLECSDTTPKPNEVIYRDCNSTNKKCPGGFTCCKGKKCIPVGTVCDSTTGPSEPNKPGPAPRPPGPNTGTINPNPSLLKPLVRECSGQGTSKACPTNYKCCKGNRCIDQRAPCDGESGTKPPGTNPPPTNTIVRKCTEKGTKLACPDRYSCCLGEKCIPTGTQCKRPTTTPSTPKPPTTPPKPSTGSTPKPPTTPPKPESGPTPPSGGGDFQSKCLAEHNRIRAKMGRPALKSGSASDIACANQAAAYNQTAGFHAKRCGMPQNECPVGLPLTRCLDMMHAEGWPKPGDKWYPINHFSNIHKANSSVACGSTPQGFLSFQYR